MGRRVSNYLLVFVFLIASLTPSMLGVRPRKNKTWSPLVSSQLCGGPASRCSMFDVGVFALLSWPPSPRDKGRRFPRLDHQFKEKSARRRLNGWTNVWSSGSVLQYT